MRDRPPVSPDSTVQVFSTLVVILWYSTIHLKLVQCSTRYSGSCLFGSRLDEMSPDFSIVIHYRHKS